MNKAKGLVTAYLLDGQGGGQQYDWKQIEQWSPAQGLLWVHLDYSVERSRHWLKQQKDLDPLVVRALLAGETRPRTLVMATGVFVSLRGVNHNPGAEPEDMVSIRIWIDKNRIISTRRRHLLTTEDIVGAIAAGTGPKTSVEFLLQYNDRLTDRMSDSIETLDELADILNEQVTLAESRLLRPKIADLRRESVLIRRYLAPQREALTRLYQDENPFLNSLERVRVRESADRIIRYIEELDSVRERSTITQEELSSRIAERLDRRMYLLALMSVIFLPITFITGLLGINVAGIPGADHPLGFMFVCLMISAISLGTLGLLRKTHWL